MAAQPIPYYGPAETNLSGVLAEFVRQPNDNSPSESNGVLTYVEKWKGPYSVAKDILTHTWTGMTITELHAVLGSSKIQRYEIPAAPIRAGQQTVWTVTGIEVQELEAGDHAILTINYEGQYNSSGSFEAIPELDVWNLSWQSYQVTPWAFCANDDYSLASYNWSPSDQAPQADWSVKANREYINQAITSPAWEIKSNDFIVYTPNLTEQDVRKYLPPANNAIRKKASLQRNATYHHPVLVHQTAKKFSGLSATYGDVIADGLDHILSAAPSGCPYTFSGDWEWIKVGDDMTETKTVRFGKTQYTRRETWWGFPKDSIDKNFYGEESKWAHTEQGIEDGRWPIGGV